MPCVRFSRFPGQPSPRPWSTAEVSRCQPLSWRGGSGPNRGRPSVGTGRTAARSAVNALSRSPTELRAIRPAQQTPAPEQQARYLVERPATELSAMTEMRAGSSGGVRCPVWTRARCSPCASVGASIGQSRRSTQHLSCRLGGRIACVVGGRPVCNAW